jgi:hypothetical protein
MPIQNQLLWQKESSSEHPLAPEAHGVSEREVVSPEKTWGAVIRRQITRQMEV